MSTTPCSECGEVKHTDTGEHCLLCQDWSYRHAICFRVTDEPWKLLGKHPTLRQIQESPHLQLVWARLNYLVKVELRRVEELLRWKPSDAGYYIDHFTMEMDICYHIPWSIYFYPSTVDPINPGTRFAASLLERHEPGTGFLKECDGLFDLEIDLDIHSTPPRVTDLNDLSLKVLGIGDVYRSQYGW